MHYHAIERFGVAWFVARQQRWRAGHLSLENSASIRFQMSSMKDLLF